MSKGLSREVFDIAAGAAVVELAPEIVGGTLSSLEAGGLNIMPQEIPVGVLHGLELAQGLVLPVATLLLMWAGFKEVMSGLNPSKSKK